MKRTILTAIALIIGVAASAQSDKYRNSFDFSLKNRTNNKHEVRLTVGSAPIFEDDFFVYDYFEPNITEHHEMIHPNDLYYRGALKTSGGYALSYMYSPCRWFSVGMYAGYVGQWQKIHLRSTQAAVSTSTERHLMFVPTVRFTYLNRPMVRLYSSIGIGVGFCRERTRNVDGRLEFSENSRFCPAEVTFLGVSVGRRLFGFAELNVGSLGCCSAGIGYKF